MQLQVGDRLTDATGEWEVVGRPYTTAGGKIVHARVQRRSTNLRAPRCEAGMPSSA